VRSGAGIKKLSEARKQQKRRINSVLLPRMQGGLRTKAAATKR
jgi:hypothetical protein